MKHNRFMIDENFGRASPYVQKRPRWERTDWSVSAGLAIGVCSMIFMVTCFYFIF